VNTSCPNCGGTFSPEEYNAPSCKYCGKVLPNYASAAAKVNQVKALMADTDETGMPNIFKGMVGPYGIPQAGAGAVPPRTGGPYAGPPVAGAPPVPPPYGAPYAGPAVQGVPQAYAAAAAIPVIIERAQRRIRTAILLGVLVPMIVVVVVGAILALSAVRATTPPPPTTHSSKR
jgi:hypothetical protein